MAKLFRPEQNCWRTDVATSAQLLIDGSAYYNDLHESLGRAQESIMILGWDLCSDVQLSKTDPTPLAQLLKSYLNLKPQLRIQILIWDSFPFFMQFREPKNEIIESFRHERLEIIFDRSLPRFASFHAKLIVIDRDTAYLGGIDLTANRFDDPSHQPRNSSSLEHRETNCQQFGEFFPIHDVQMKIQGPVAKSLWILAEEQWHRSAKSSDSLNYRMGSDISKGIEIQNENSLAAISRTYASWQDWPAHHEIKNLYCDLIKNAKDFIYIECQYFSSRDVTQFLCESLQKNSGPEVIIVTSESYRGWWEAHTLGAIRNDRLQELRQADLFGRLGIYYPAQSDDSSIAVHSKLMLIDGRIACVGSANLTNRSLYLDTEYCVTIDDSHKPPALWQPLQWTTQLLSEHLNLDQEELKRQVKGGKSILFAIRSSDFSLGRSHGRTLREIKAMPEDLWSKWLKHRKWSDPDGPLGLEEILKYKNIAEMPEIFHG